MQILWFANTILLLGDGGHLLFLTSKLLDRTVLRATRRKNLWSFPFELFHHRGRINVQDIKVTVLWYIASFVLIFLQHLNLDLVVLARFNIRIDPQFLINLLGQLFMLMVFKVDPYWLNIGSNAPKIELAIRCLILIFFLQVNFGVLIMCLPKNSLCWEGLERYLKWYQLNFCSLEENYSWAFCRKATSNCL